MSKIMLAHLSAYSNMAAFPLFQYNIIQTFYTAILRVDLSSLGLTNYQNTAMRGPGLAKQSEMCVQVGQLLTAPPNGSGVSCTAW